MFVGIDILYAIFKWFSVYDFIVVKKFNTVLIQTVSHQRHTYLISNKTDV